MLAARILLLCALLGIAACSRQAPPSQRREEPLALPAQDTSLTLQPAVPLSSPATAGARYPFLATAEDGSLLLSWLEPAGQPGAFRLRFARWEESARGWGASRTVAQGNDWFVNWADFPSVVPLGDGRIVAHWLQQRPGNVYSYDVRIAFSQDHGVTWSESWSPHDDGTPTEHGFVSLGRTTGGQAYAIWLDGRKTVAAGPDTHATHGGDASGPMTLRGAMLEPDGPTAGVEIDGRTCDCCQTGLARAGNVLIAVYRDREPDETRDIKVARFDQGRWSAPLAVHQDGWRIAACPVNGPAIDARGELVAVAWFTAAGGTPRIRLAYSTDGARSFAAPLEIASGAVTGRVDLVLLDSGHAVVSWLAEPGAVRARVCNRDGCQDSLTVAETDVARSSGFPRMATVGRGLVFAWTAHGATPGLRTAYVPLD